MTLQAITRAALAVIVIATLAVLSPQAKAQTSNSQPELQQEYMRQIAQLVEYIGVDYSEAVANGEVVNAGEYAEMEEFSSIILRNINTLATDNQALQRLVQPAQQLRELIMNKADLAEVRGATSQLRAQILQQLPKVELPKALSPTAQTKELYQTQCSACHGQQGQGDGPAGQNLEPAPTNFTDLERAENRSLLGLYDAITKGIDDTAMMAFTNLTEQQRWSLAFYVGSLAFQQHAVDAPQASVEVIDLQQMVNTSPAQLRAELPSSQANLVNILRANPQRLFEAEISPFAVAKARLKAAEEAYAAGDVKRANHLAVSAYLDGFELMENGLSAYDAAQTKAIEAQMMDLRRIIAVPNQQAKVSAAINETIQALDHAQATMTEQQLSNTALASASFVILLREGLEALLVVLALITVLRRTERNDAVKYVHTGWVTALVLGGLTWWAAQSLISISGASREIMEGVAAALAAVVLVYVGIWMHSKTNAQAWQQYIKQHLHSHLAAGTLWGIALLSFVAVYREVFETVLFYQSLLTQAQTGQHSSVWGGFIAAAAVLTVVTWVMLRFSLKLPIAKFFAYTTYLLLALAFVLAGKAIIAFQEAGWIAATPFPVPLNIDWLGMAATWQSLGAQLAVLLVFWWYRRRSIT
ncbi:cytochrome c/FTR1 family iron permease [Pseudidiomarina sp.]|uniref:cytochrome c/FTR1 family iron permease n=1 Tax=Pseudidiomarina sp. TaxID=2081707 RepID=UPI003A98407B